MPPRVPSEAKRGKAFTPEPSDNRHLGQHDHSSSPPSVVLPRFSFSGA